MMQVEMQLSRIIISEITEQQLIYLKEVEGEREFPIMIGRFEATSIDRRVKSEVAPRPLTHDLLVNVIEEMGGEPKSVIITDLKDRTYFAHLMIQKDGEQLSIDARPSDAIAIAVTCDPTLPIYVEDEVLEAAGDE